MKIVKPEPVSLIVEEVKQYDLKVSMEFILKLRDEAERQKISKNAKAFAKILGNTGKDIPETNQESVSKLNEIADSFEIIEE